MKLAIDALSPGQAANFHVGTRGLTQTLLHNDAGDPSSSALQSITEFATKAPWNPLTGLEFIGHSHPNNNVGKHIAYDEVTDLWSLRATFGNLAGVIDFVDQGAREHSYQHNTIVEVSGGNRELWLRAFGQSRIVRWNPATNTYSELTPNAGSGKGIFSGIEYFPERNSVIFNTGSYDGVWEYSISSGTWSQRVAGSFFTGWSGDNGIAWYTPAMGGRVFIGGGSTTLNAWITAAGTAVALAAAPYAYGSDGVSEPLTCVDPVTGSLLLFRNTSPTELWEYDPRRDAAAGGSGGNPAWERLNGTGASGRNYEGNLSLLTSHDPEGPGPWSDYIVMSSIWHHGAIMFILPGAGGAVQPRSVLYKHASF